MRLKKRHLDGILYGKKFLSGCLENPWKQETRFKTAEKSTRTLAAIMTVEKIPIRHRFVLWKTGGFVTIAVTHKSIH
jgi:hypothetical protein